MVMGGGDGGGGGDGMLMSMMVVMKTVLMPVSLSLRASSTRSQTT